MRMEIFPDFYCVVGSYGVKSEFDSSSQNVSGFITHCMNLDVSSRQIFFADIPRTASISTVPPADITQAG